MDDERKYRELPIGTVVVYGTPTRILSSLIIELIIEQIDDLITIVIRTTIFSEDNRMYTRRLTLSAAGSVGPALAILIP